MPASQGYISKQPNVTDSGVAPSTARGKKAPKETAEDKILKVLRAEAATDSPTSLGPKIIASRAHIPEGTAKGTLKRMKESDPRIIRDEIGWRIVAGTAEAEVTRQLKAVSDKSALPRVHDLHVTFKVENIRKVLAKNPEIPDLFKKLATQIELQAPYREPVAKKGTNHNIDGYKKGPRLTPPLPTPPSSTGQELPPVTSPGLDFIDRIFNPMDPASIIALWFDPNKKYVQLNGGFQDLKPCPGYDLKFQLYWNGTMKIIIGCSDQPMDYSAFHEALADIDGVFWAKTGIRFKDIWLFFHIETAHIGNDMMAGPMEFSGQSKLNITIPGLDGVLRRIYEKVLGPGNIPVIRDEVNLLRGNIDEHSLAAFDKYFQVFEESGVSPSQTKTELYISHKEMQKLEGLVNKIAVDHLSSKEMIRALRDSNAELRELVMKAIKGGALVPSEDGQELTFKQYIPRKKSHSTKENGGNR